MMLKNIFLALAICSLLGSYPAVASDTVPANWLAAAKPFRLAGPIYYVGTQGLGVYLIKSNAGLILLSGAMPPSVGTLSDSIKALGFKLQEVKLILISHAHADHVGTLAEMKKLTGAPVVAMEAEAELLRSGGKSDYLFGKNPSFHFTPVNPDRLITDGNILTFGDVHLTAHATPGHTPGCTTWETDIEDRGTKYNVVFLDGTTVNPGTKFGKSPSYPGIASDYHETFKTLQALHPDIFLAYHAEFFDLEGKSKRLAEGIKPWIDPAGYKSLVEKNKAKFEKLLHDEAKHKN